MAVPVFDKGLVLGGAAADPGSGDIGTAYWSTLYKRPRIKKTSTEWVDLADLPPIPDSWTIWGHSYWQYAFGTVDQTGRADALLRARLDVEHGHWRNWAVNGAQLIKDGNSQGGYSTILQNKKPPQRGGPYPADGGAAVLGYGINDIGYLGQSSAWKTAYQHALRTAISRLRASVVFENDFSVGTRTSYGAGFGSVGTPDWSSGPRGAGTIHWATSLTNANITLTIPTDYDGETIGICMGGQAGVAGGNMAITGTAGVTGNISNSNIVPTGGGTHTPVTYRITNLTASNAGQTIILTGNALDAGGALQFDCWWLESKSPPAIIVCNIAKLTAAGYTNNYNATWSGTEAQRDADVDTWNTAIASVVAEFDGMVQLADIDTALGPKTASLFFDGLHPNEVGAGKVVDALDVARKKMVPPAVASSISATYNPPAPRCGPVRRPRRSSSYYTTDCKGAGSNYTPVSGEQFWMPFWISEGREKYNGLVMENVTAGSVNGALRWGLYDDPDQSGYPNRCVNEATIAGAFTVTFASGVKSNPGSGGGSIVWVMDPGMWWLSIKCTTTGTGMAWRTVAGPSLWLPNLSSTGGLSLNPVAYKLTGQGTGALSTTAPSGATLTDNAPMVGLLMV